MLYVWGLLGVLVEGYVDGWDSWVLGFLMGWKKWLIRAKEGKRVTIVSILIFIRTFHVLFTYSSLFKSIIFRFYCRWRLPSDYHTYIQRGLSIKILILIVIMKPPVTVLCCPRNKHPNSTDCNYIWFHF